MVDSNYKDIDNHQTLLTKMPQTPQMPQPLQPLQPLQPPQPPQIPQIPKTFKIVGDIFDDNGTQNIKDMCFDAFKKAFDPNIFKNAFTNYGGIRPPSDIINLIDKTKARVV